MAALRRSYGQVALVAWGIAGLVCVDAFHASAAPGTYEITLNDMSHSGEHAVAVLKPIGNTTLVTIKTTGGPADPQPAHFTTVRARSTRRDRSTCCRPLVER